ncbi:multifunctional CCA addition/repair protein [Thalassotalea agarivorans]|uniref:multifunctional CCA addition/repair protein n=1 Tax=Thalassotalea agarivorans TaxID=349064 RepID=UPI001FE014BA|nr:multifunctional CCA addition/repair protein [Thalassotalea agarivorans]
MKQTQLQISDLDTYLVGGAVRDSLLGHPVKDKDYLVVGADVERMLSLGFTQVGKDFPVFLHPESKDEYALARTEKKAGQGYAGFTCYAEPDVTLEQDLLRRDLTINAMAIAKDGSLLDPYDGQADLDNRLLRHVSPAFVEDPLRVLRVARFAARYHQYGFVVAEETLSLMTQLSQSGELNTLSGERVWQEMVRALAEPNPEIFIEVLRACGALAALLPELDKLWGIPNPAQWHPEIDSGVHTLMVLKQAVIYTKDTKIRFATLMHDVGKGLTPENEWPSHRGHEKAGIALIDNVCERLRIPNDYRKLARLVSEFHLHAHRAFELKPVTILKVFNALDIWRNPDMLDAFVISCQADFTGRTGSEQSPYPQADYLMQCAKACSSISARHFVERGLQGAQIKQAIIENRIAAIDEIKKAV